MLKEPTALVRVTFYQKDRGEETEADRLAACAGSIGSCLPGVMGVFRFYDESGDMSRHVEYMKRAEEELADLSARIKRAKSPSPILRLRRQWKKKTIESMRAKEVELVILQMAVSGVVEEKRGQIYNLDNNELFTILEDLHTAGRVEIGLCRGRLRAPSLELVA